MEATTERDLSTLLMLQFCYGSFVPEEDMELEIGQDDEYLDFFDEMIGQLTCPA